MIKNNKCKLKVKIKTEKNAIYCCYSYLKGRQNCSETGGNVYEKVK